MSIDCPSGCAYLIAAHRYEDKQQRSVPAETPFLEERIPADFLHIHQQLLAAMAFTIAKFCAANPFAADPDVVSALRALAETYKTLGAGIYYEKQPDIPVQRELYAALASFLDDVKKQQTAATGLSPLKDGDVFFLTIFLYRMGLLRTNGRPKARRFIEFLRGQFPQAQELKQEESRIIVP